jgi:hypothetical protein
MTERDPLLVERNKTHGSFRLNAHFSQTLKSIVQSDSSGYALMKPEHREALDMIMMKVSRLMSGHAHFKDHWDDIAGYAKLGAEACED